MIFVGQYLPPIISVVAFFAILVFGVWLEGRFGELRARDDEFSTLAPCEHADLSTVFTPRSTDGCEECVKNNYKWVHRACFNMRACRMLRFVAIQTRDEALSQGRSRDHGFARAGGKPGLVLRRRTVRTDPPTDSRCQRDSGGAVRHRVVADHNSGGAGATTPSAGTSIFAVQMIPFSR